MLWRRLPLTIRVALYYPLWVMLVCIGIPTGLWWLGRRLGLPEMLPPPYHLLGIPLVLAGTAAVFTCVAYFYRQGRGTAVPYDPPLKLVTGGPYAYCRNPMVAGQGVMLLGMGLLLRSWLIVVVLAAAAVGAHWYHRHIEERHLVERFGAEYEQYRRQVPMWLPRRRPYRRQ